MKTSIEQKERKEEQLPASGVPRPRTGGWGVGMEQRQIILSKCRKTKMREMKLNVILSSQGREKRCTNLAEKSLKSIADKLLAHKANNSLSSPRIFQCPSEMGSQGFDHAAAPLYPAAPRGSAAGLHIRDPFKPQSHLL